MDAETLSNDVPEPSHAPLEWTVLHGWVQPHDDRSINLATLTAWLRGRAIAAVSASAPAAGEAATIGLVVTVPHTADDDMLVAGQGTTGPEPRVPLQELADDLAAEFDVSVSLGEVWADSRDEEQYLAADDTAPHAPDDSELPEGSALPEEDDEKADDEGQWLLEHPLVVVSRAPESVLPLLAHDLDAELSAVHVDGWTVALAKADYVFLEHHGWMRGELPAAAVGRSDERRYVAVVATPGQPEEFGLVRYDDLIPVLDPIGVSPDVAEALTLPHLAHGSAVRRLCATRPFAHVTPHELAAVLQSPMDDRWTSRVLAALGFPLEAAEIAEGRTVPGPDAAVVAPRGFWAAAGEMLVRYYDAPAHEVATRTPYGKAYAALTSSPATVAASVTLEAAAAALAWTAAGRTSGWRAGLWRTLAVSLAADVAGHAVLAPLKFRRR